MCSCSKLVIKNIAKFAMSVFIVLLKYWKYRGIDFFCSRDKGRMITVWQKDRTIYASNLNKFCLKFLS